MKKQAALIAQALQSHEVRAIRILARRSAGSFERLGSMPGLGQMMVDRFIDQGLAEVGTVNGHTGAIGYRPTALGSAVFEAIHHRRPRSAPLLRALDPWTKQMPGRFDPET